MNKQILRLTTEYIDRIRKHQEKLSELIDPKYGLTQILQTRGVFSINHCEEIKEEKTTATKNRKLLELLLRATRESDLVWFSAALKETGQQHVLNYILWDGGKFFLSV